MKIKHLLYATLLLSAISIKSHAGIGMPITVIPFELCVATTINPVATKVSTVPASVQFSTSATGAPVQSINTYRQIQLQNQGASDLYFGFNVGVSTFTGFDVPVGSGTVILPVMENVRLWFIPQIAGGQALITYCR